MEVDRKKLRRLFNFLDQHREWNAQFQQDHYRRTLLHCQTPLRRLKALMYSTVNTQSQPKLGSLGGFWKAFNEFQPSGRPDLEGLCAHLEHLEHLKPRRSHAVEESVGAWERLFNALSRQNGWGPKTAALFVKNVINVHRGPKELHFLLDRNAGADLSNTDRVYLPVDAVIVHIFERLGRGRATFNSVNKVLMSEYTPDQMLVWDDLWYWGFFSQSSAKDGSKTSGHRKMAWNEDKFWCQEATPKESIREVKRLARKFISLC